MFDDLSYSVSVLPELLKPVQQRVADEERVGPEAATAPMAVPNEATKIDCQSTISSASAAACKSPFDDLAVFSRTSSISEGDYSMNPMDYRLEEPIGYGSSAIVHLAMYLPTQTQVAIKIIDLDRFEKNQIDVLRREIQVMSLCRHPNLLSVLASFVHESQLWIVTPFLAAGSCLDLLRCQENREGIMNEAAIATILWQALQGIVYLHQHGHIHRDIKAGNLLMDTDGQVQLADFGVSSSLLDSHGGRGETSGVPGGIRKTFVGTPCWMAPEIMEMTKGYDFKADIWSFGITAMELANGNAPYHRLPAMKVIFVTLSNDPPKLNRHRALITFSRNLKELIGLCLQKGPSKRPTAEALLKHPFFKQAKKKDYLAAELLVAIPPIQQRAKVNTAKMNERRGARMASSLKNETIPEEDWDFSSSDELNAADAAAPLELADATSVPLSDKRGRFVVESATQVVSPTSTILFEEHQTSIGSSQDNNCLASEIRKGRFSVNPNPEPLSPTALDVEEEGRKSRFEIVPPPPIDTPKLSQRLTSSTDTDARVNQGQTTDLEEPVMPPNIYRPSPYHHVRPGHFTERPASHLPSEYPPFVGSQYVHVHQQQLDQLIHWNELARQQLFELRMRMPSHSCYHAAYQGMYGPPLAEYGMFFGGGGASPHMSHVSSASGSTAEVMSETHAELERQLAQLKLENEQLRRRD